VRVPELEMMLDEDEEFIYEVFILLKNRCAQGGEFAGAQMIEFQSIYYFTLLFDCWLTPNEIKHIMMLDTVYNNTVAGLKK
jgi:hypothetical protein